MPDPEFRSVASVLLRTRRLDVLQHLRRSPAMPQMIADESGMALIEVVKVLADLVRVDLVEEQNAFYRLTLEGHRWSQHVAGCERTKAVVSDPERN